MQNYSLIIRWAVAAFAMLWLGCAQAVVLDVDSTGHLMGATNVDVNGASYDVQFLDGSCISRFLNCNPDLFAFNNEADATAASQALLDSVFIDSTLGLFDTDPELTSGCLSTEVCAVLTPYGLVPHYPHLVSVVVARNGAPLSQYPDIDPYTAIQQNNLGTYAEVERPIVERSSCR